MLFCLVQIRVMEEVMFLSVKSRVSGFLGENESSERSSEMYEMGHSDADGSMAR